MSACRCIFRGSIWNIIIWLGTEIYIDLYISNNFFFFKIFNDNYCKGFILHKWWDISENACRKYTMMHALQSDAVWGFAAIHALNRQFIFPFFLSSWKWRETTQGKNRRFNEKIWIVLRFSFFFLSLLILMTRQFPHHRSVMSINLHCTFLTVSFGTDKLMFLLWLIYIFPVFHSYKMSPRGCIRQNIFKCENKNKQKFISIRRSEN